MIELRPYQSNLVDSVRAAFGRSRRVLAVLPTGGGKTYSFSYMADAVARKNGSALILAHRQELVAQASGSLESLGVDHQVLAAKTCAAFTSGVAVGSIQTVARQIGNMRAPRLIIADEAHHSVSGQWTRLVQAFPESFLLGVTATPCRLDGRGLGEIYGEMVIGPNVRELIVLGNLVPSQIWSTPQAMSFDACGMRGGDFRSDEVESIMQAQRNRIFGDAVTTYRAKANGKRAVVFTNSVRMANDMSAEFRMAGYRFAPLDGKMSDADRKAVVRMVKNGELDGITSCEIVSEGFDCPGLEVAILLRPTKSLSLYLQQVGRVIRPAPGKTHGIILDHVGNVLRFGPPEVERVWTLEGSGQGCAKDPQAVDVSVCKKCLAYIPARLKACPMCGTVAPPKPRELAMEAGELVEYVHGQRVGVALTKEDLRLIDWAKTQRLRDGSKPELLRDWKQLAEERGKKSGFGWHIFKALQKGEAVYGK